LFTDDERFHETLKLEFAQRSEMVNNVRLDINYKYPRRRERKIRFRWDSHNKNSLQGFLCATSPGQGSYQLCQRSMVEGSVNGSSWIPITAITYDPIWPATIVSCGGGMYDVIVWGMSVVNFYTPNPENPNHKAVNVDTGETVTDRTLGYEAPTPPEVTNKLCIGARWTAARRWIQDVEEYYEIIVKCQDSIDSIGVVANTESYSFDSGIEDNSWENSLTPYVENSPSNGKIISGSQDSYWNGDEIEEFEDKDIFNRDDFDKAQEVILATAKIDILKAHRLTTVSFKVPYNSLVDLASTVSVSTPGLSAIGKVKILKHNFSIDTGEASSEIFLAISRHNGSGLFEDEPLEPLERPEPLAEESLPNSITLNNYIGGRKDGCIGFSGKWYDGRSEGKKDPNNEDVWIEEPWEGFMTNFEFPVLRQQYASLMSGPSELVDEGMYYYYMDASEFTIPYQFVVKGPDIDEKYTSSQINVDPITYNVVIPVDYLVLNSY
jgi:hypothetical protein